ncbi:MAG: cysteine desulfurase NifS [Synergistales bacterium]|nr:cysteine desulfurase NifS [Synergistales bacterium]
MIGRIYLDNAATTGTDTEVLNEMLPYFMESFGNPSSIYSFSRDNRIALERSRGQVARAINAEPAEIYFTGGGTESDNWALKGAAFARRGSRGHIITTMIEHHAILHSAEFLAGMGYDVTYLPVDEEGRIDLKELEGAFREDTFLVSVMFANNEIGTIQPVSEIGRLCKKRNVLFHTDAVQAVGHIPIDVKAMHIDMLSLSAHKFHGPKGVGALFIRRGVKIENFIHGGGQEKGRRASTENVPGIVGLGKALEISIQRIGTESARQSMLRDRLIKGILETIPYARLNGPGEDGRLPNNVNFSFIGVEGETLILDLDEAGISASTGSACSSGSLDPSHVLLAIGLDHAHSHGSLRMTLGTCTSENDIDYVLDTLPAIISRRREMSPLWEDFLRNEKKVTI